ncbi:type VI secretion system tip protein TssI/VgrG [Burkholderia cepacia]|uniref:type VI secretion system tip protein TssI/VgrG n=1 Tax=Burkholderia cepacia TaxID=292 RepID=UPI0026517A76|nr:type VI secretion system tip protein TssI/VgrG [Burkholderia cepacia]MDN7902475.1 type VI secretion system tip protein TssI/VgrG [Burkholderia cepacia]
MVDRTDLRFTFTAGDESFEVVEFTLHEGLSETFLLQVELASANSAIDFGQVLDRNGLLTIWQGGLPVRYVHGAVSSFVQGDTGFRRTRYSAVVEPRLARLKLSSDWRIFQTLSVPEIATAVLKAHNQTLDYEQRVTAEHLAREYCVQAGDTDYDFTERILREEGFFYAFQHKADGHRLIHCDRLFIFGRQQGEPVLYNPTPGGDQPQPCLRKFAYTENVRTARQVQRDYTFKSPRFAHEYPREGTDLDHQGRGYARYDYPGRYKHEASGKAFTQDRLRGHRRDARIALVSGDDARLQPGIAFDLTGHPREDMNRGWRPVSIVHHGKQYTSQAEESADAQQGTHYRYEAVLVPGDAEWRAEPLPRPRIDGPQPATVVGPKGEEIYTDEYGRVKVQFPWDREGKHDEHSSCWIQVAQNWAGATWGHMAIPRIGQEVIVVNLDGDPDQPLIIGRAYNRLQLPPYELPRHKTRMTIKSQTHKGEGFNELRFEDEAGQEEIYVHAQKDQNIHVNHDETTFVGHALGEAGFSAQQRKQIYFGNWLRDYSQLLDPKIVRPPSAEKDLSRYLSRGVLTRVVDLLALREFHSIQNLKDSSEDLKDGKNKTYLLNQKMLGVYRPSEHIDNPSNFKPDPADPRTVDPAFEPWALKGDQRLDVDKASSMKRYIFDSRDYMSAQLNIALGAGPTSKGFRHFGAALHVLEDYFAHSNFVELSLRKFHPNVLAWTAPRSSAQSRHALPVVTGMFGSLDIIASLAEPMAQMMFPVDDGEFKPTKPGQRSDGEHMMLILLEDHRDGTYLAAFDQFLKFRDSLASVPGYELAARIAWVAKTPLRAVTNAYNLVFQAMIQLIGNSVDDVQTYSGSDPNADESMDPSHSQLAKDHDVHPFHSLAATLAKHAVCDVGQAMKARWDGRRTATDPVTLAASYLVHPNDCQWQDAIVKAWALANPDAIRRGASRTELEHLHEAHGKQALERLRQIGRYGVAGRDYIQKYYETLFGEKNQIAR